MQKPWKNLRKTIVVASRDPLEEPLGALLGRLGGLLGRLGALLGRLGALWGASWAGLGGLLGPLGQWEGRKGDNAKIIEQPKEHL